MNVTERAEERRSAFRVRVRLVDFVAWLPAIAIVATVWREVELTTKSWPAGDTYRNLGLFGASLAILLAMALLREVLVRIRARRARAGRPSLGSIAWRIGVVSLLAVFVAWEIDALRADWTYWLPETAVSRESLRIVLPIGATLGMAGVIAGMTVGRTARPRRHSGVMVVGAAAVGVLYLASEAIIPYLVMIAIEAVDHAMVHRTTAPGSWPSVYRRLMWAGFEGLIVLSLCVLLGIWLSRELRRPPSNADLPAKSCRGYWVLAGLTVATALGAVRMLTVTIPTWQSQMAEGLRMRLVPPAAAAIVVGFAGLAAGIAARAADVPIAQVPLQESERWRRIKRVLGFLLQAALALVLLDVMLSRVLYDPIASGQIEAGWSEGAFQQFRASLPFASSISWIWRWEVLGLVLAQVWIAWRVVLLLITPVRLEPTPLDANLDNHLTFARFVLRWLALLILMVTALPVLFVEGLALYHIILHPF